MVGPKGLEVIPMESQTPNPTEQRLAAARILEEQFEIPGQEGIVDEKRFLNWLRRLRKPKSRMLDAIEVFPASETERDELHVLYANLGFIPDGSYKHLMLKSVGEKMVTTRIGWNYDNKTGDPRQYEFDTVMCVVMLEAAKENDFKSGAYKLDRRDWEYRDLQGMVGKRVNIKKFLKGDGKGRICNIVLDKL